MVIIRKLHQVSTDMSLSEGLIKLVIIMLFVPIPILVGAIGGFWLDYYKLNTLPLLTVAGTILGTLIAFGGVCQIIIYRHKRRN